MPPYTDLSPSGSSVYLVIDSFAHIITNTFIQPPLYPGTILDPVTQELPGHRC